MTHLTAWTKVLHNELVTLISQKFHKNKPPIRIRNMNPHHIGQPSFLKIEISIILPSTPRYSKKFLILSCAGKTFVFLLLMSYA